MPKINQYTDNSTIEDTDAMLTYDPSNGGATKLTTFARIASWMSAKLAALAKKTAITSADQILMVNGSATARIDYNVLAKAIIEQYAGSTLAGSAQSVMSAFSKSLSAIGTKITDANTATEVGSYYCPNLSESTNFPDHVKVANLTGQLLVIYRAATTRITQILFVYVPNSNPLLYVRMQKGESVWSDWVDVMNTDKLFVSNDNTTGTNNIDATNVDSLVTPCIYNKYIDVDSIVGQAGYGGKHFGMFIVSCPPYATRIGQYILMPSTGMVLMRYSDGTTWGKWRYINSTAVPDVAS